jgi:hypothetical protein
MCHLIRQDEILLFPGSCQVKYSEASQWKIIMQYKQNTAS